VVNTGLSLTDTIVDCQLHLMPPFPSLPISRLKLFDTVHQASPITSLRPIHLLGAPYSPLTLLQTPSSCPKITVTPAVVFANSSGTLTAVALAFSSVQLSSFLSEVTLTLLSGTLISCQNTIV